MVILTTSYICRCGCCCLSYLVAPIVIAMLMEFLFGVWFMNQRQGLLPPPSHISSTKTCSSHINEAKSYTRIGRYEILERVPHDPNSFTQGLVMIAGTSSKNYDVDTSGNHNSNSQKMVDQNLYEGTGMYGSSQLRRLNNHNGDVLAFHPLENSYFGEGIAHFRDKMNRLHIIQLTWKRRRAFEYIFNADKKNGVILESHNNDRLIASRITNWRFQTTTNEGWGITYSPFKHLLYVSDGSEFIHIWDAETKREIHKIAVQYQHSNLDKLDQPKPITMLNELEYDPVTNTILANVWREDVIIRIDPETGFVTTIYDLKNLLPKRDRTWHTDVLNGIALTYDLSFPSQQALGYDEDSESSIAHDEIWVTGKYWPYMFRIRLIDNRCTSIGENKNVILTKIKSS